MHSWSWAAASSSAAPFGIISCIFRDAFDRHGLPQVIYTDGLSHFGPSSSHDHSERKSEFQHALRALHVAHIVAPTHQYKCKTEPSLLNLHFIATQHPQVSSPPHHPIRRLRLRNRAQFPRVGHRPLPPVSQIPGARTCTKLNIMAADSRPFHPVICPFLLRRPQKWLSKVTKLGQQRFGGCFFPPMAAETASGNSQHFRSIR